jgi:hypothetical protein
VHDDAAKDGGAVRHPALGMAFRLHAIEFIDCHAALPSFVLCRDQPDHLDGPMLVPLPAGCGIGPLVDFIA